MLGSNKVSLSEICDLIPGFAFKSQDFTNTCDKVIKIADIQPPYVFHKDLKSVNISGYKKEKLAKFIAKSGDLVLAMTGATIGKLGRLQRGHAYVNQRVLLLKPKENIDKDYFYYSLLGVNFQKFILNHIDSQTAQPNISATTIGKYTIPIPSLEEQKRIGKILRSLDRKIELNLEINDNLQKQAEAIYSRLYIDARNCNQVPLKDIANITMGQSPAGHSCSEKNEGTVFYQGRAEFGFRFPTRRLFTTEPKRMAKVGDILLSVRAPVGDINVAYEDCCIGRGLSAIESKTGEPSFLLYTLRYLRHQFEVFNAEGTVFGNINKEQLNNFQINLPPKDKIKEFESIVQPMDDLILMNFKENNLLNELKEKLLLNFFSNK